MGLPLNVAQLRAQLQEMEEQGHGEVSIRLEGCDCWGDAGGLSLTTDRDWPTGADRPVVLIERTD